MKKLIQSALVLGMVALTLSSCEDVPSPFDLDNGNGKTEEAVTQPAGEGTAESPYNVAKALDIITAGTYTNQNVVIKGVVSKIGEFSADYGNISYYIADSKSGRTSLQIYRGKSFNKAKFVTGSEIAVGDTVVLSGVLTVFNSTQEVKDSYLISVNGKGGSTTPDTPSTTQPAGKGTAAEPYNVAAAIATVSAMEADKPSESEIYIKGKVADEPTIDTGQYGNASFTITDDSKNSFKVFRIFDLGNKKFTSSTAVKKGDEVVIRGQVVNYKGNTPETQANKAYLVSVNGKTVSEQKPEEKPNTGGETGGATGDEMTATLITSGSTGSISLDTNKYGSQSISDESTWYTWKFNNVTYKGAKVCISDGKQGEGIQMQGNAEDASKQGFIFNADAFKSDIAKITVVMSVAKSSKYDPGFNLYAGTAAHPTGTPVAATPTIKENGNYKEYTYVYDLSSSNYKFFTLANDKVGAVYIKSIKIALK